MTTETNTQTTAPKEIDTAALDQVVGAGSIMVEARNQEQADKLAKENQNKVSA